MKKIFFLLTILSFLTQNKAQNQIVNSTDCDSYFNWHSGNYYRKDLIR